ncbi:DUF1622 domain-containing protein, partial|uniref:DUF1622 domain-containing protein n=1 Tax=Escherichia coli TaxID=562 RepID=UPI0014438D9C
MLTDLLHVSILATVVDFLGTLLIGIGAVRTLIRYLRANDVPTVINRIHQSLAADLVTALSFKSGAGIIRTLTVAD